MKYAIKLNLMYLSYFNKINDDTVDTEFSRNKSDAFVVDSINKAQEIIDFLGYPEDMMTIVVL